MKFIDDFLFYEVKGDGKDEIIRKVAKIDVKDKETQTENESSKSEQISQSNAPKIENKGTQTEFSKDDISKMEKEINEVREISKNIKNKKKVYFEISPFPSMYTFGKNVFMNEMLEIAGVENIFNDKSGWFISSLEVIAARNPDIIFTSTYQVDDPVKEIIDRGNWNIIKAVREGKIYLISKEAVRPSIKIIEIIKKIAEISYPEYYKEIEKIAVD